MGGFRLTIATTLASLLPAMTLAQGLDQTGRWAVSGPWGHQSVHLVLLRGDGTQHSKLLSWYQGRQAKLYGWDPGFSLNGSTCSTFPDQQFQMLPLDTTVVDLISSGHSSLANGDVLISGGLDFGYAANWPVHRFQRNAVTPPQWIPQDSLNFERRYHASTTLGNGDVMVHGGASFYQMAVYGGTEDPASPSSAVREEIRRFALKWNPRWLSTQTPALRPEPREGHSAVSFGVRGELDTTLVFAGRGSGGQLLNDAWALRVDGSIDTMDWDPIGATDPPPARTRHSAVKLDDRRMVIYGGLGATGARSDLRELRPPVGVLPWRWSANDLSPGGPDDPGARYGHAAIYDGAGGRNRMLVFGGRGNGGLVNNDLYALDLTTPAWSRPVPTTPDKPAAREGHSWTVDPYPRTGPFSTSDRRAVLFGGQTSAGVSHEVWVLWIGPNGAVRWEQKTPVNPPSGRTRHAAAWDESFAPNQPLDRLLVHGGDTGGSASAETWALDLSLSAWSPLASAGHATAGHSATFRTSPLVALHAERYSAATGQWTLESSPRNLPTHPNMFLLPSGNLFFAGPGTETQLYQTTGPPPHWSSLGTSGVIGQPAVLLYRPNPDQAVEIMKCGGYFQGTGETAKITIKANDTAPLNWQEQNLASPDTLMARVNHNLVVLPTGKVLATGGRRFPREDETAADTLDNPAVHQPQIWDPDLGPAGAWLGGGVLAPDPARRGFHSTAILLPDARVLSLGNEGPGAFRFLASVFCPPYLFNPDGSLAERPTIAAWHDSAGYNQSLSIWTESPETIASVSLIKPGAVTHSHNQDQRYLKLDFQVVARLPEQGCPVTELVATTPAHANLAPPGDYLLFLLKRSPFDVASPPDTLVPSVAQWVRLRSGPNGPMAGGPPSTCPPLSVPEMTPSRFTLHQNRPNPFAGTTNIRFDLPVQSQVKLEVFDLLGRRVRTLAAGRFAPGRHGVDWDQRDDRGLRLRAGVFAYRLTAGAFQDRRLMVVLP